MFDTIHSFTCFGVHLYSASAQPASIVRVDEQDYASVENTFALKKYMLFTSCKKNPHYILSLDYVVPKTGRSRPPLRQWSDDLFAQMWFINV